MCVCMELKSLFQTAITSMFRLPPAWRVPADPWAWHLHFLPYGLVCEVPCERVSPTDVSIFPPRPSQCAAHARLHDCMKVHRNKPGIRYSRGVTTAGPRSVSVLDWVCRGARRRRTHPYNNTTPFPWSSSSPAMVTLVLRGG